MIRFENVTKIYEDGTAALDNITFMLKKGVCVCCWAERRGKSRR